MLEAQVGASQRSPSIPLWTLDPYNAGSAGFVDRICQLTLSKVLGSFLGPGACWVSESDIRVMTPWQLGVCVVITAVPITKLFEWGAFGRNNTKRFVF
jgi:hypothetical protein